MLMATVVPSGKTKQSGSWRLDSRTGRPRRPSRLTRSWSAASSGVQGAPKIGQFVKDPEMRPGGPVGRDPERHGALQERRRVVPHPKPKLFAGGTVIASGSAKALPGAIAREAPACGASARPCAAARRARDRPLSRSRPPDQAPAALIGLYPSAASSGRRCEPASRRDTSTATGR